LEGRKGQTVGRRGGKTGMEESDRKWEEERQTVGGRAGQAVGGRGDRQQEEVRGKQWKEKRDTA